MEELLPGLHRRISALTGVHQPVNSYFWQYNHGGVLVDPSADLTPDHVRTRDAVPVADILVTHLQEENAAGAANFPEAHLHVPAGDEYLCRGVEAYRRLITGWGPPWDWTTKGNYQGNIGGARNERPLPRPVRLAESLHPQTSWEECEILATSGHGKNAVTILTTIAGRRVAFCGDLIFGDGQLWNWFDSEWDYGLQTGQRALRESVALLLSRDLDLLCPTHGEPIGNPSAALRKLHDRLTAVLADTPTSSDLTPSARQRPSPARGFSQLLPHLHQWTATPGNCAVVVSETGNALMVDDGLCYWEPIPKRTANHRAVIEELKRGLGLRKIEVVIPSHYHGDHIENIPDLVEMEESEVVSLDVVAEVIEHPERSNLICPLRWYAAAHDLVRVDRRLREGERWRWHEYEFEFFILGGQTYYSNGVAVEVDGVRTLFVGDSLSPTSALCEPVICYNDAEPASRGWAFAIDRLIERKPDLIVCSHAESIRDPMPLLQRKRDAWRQRLAEFAALCPRPGVREFFDPFLG